MNFKSANCPSCGGNLQLPDNLNTVKCMYCGVDIVVQDAIRLSGRVKELTQATPVEKTYNFPEPEVAIRRAKNTRNSFFIAFFVLSGIISLCIGSISSQNEKGFALFLFIFSTIIIIILYFATRKSSKKVIEELSKPSIPEKMLIGYEGQCPYCNSLISLKASGLGDNCPACHKRIVIRDSKFYSVDTPVSGLN